MTQTQPISYQSPVDGLRNDERTLTPRQHAIAPGVTPLVPPAVLEAMGSAAFVATAGRVVQAALRPGWLEGLGPLPISLEAFVNAFPCSSEGRLLAWDDVPVVRALRGEPCRDIDLVVSTGPSAGHTLRCNASPLYDEAGMVIGAVVAIVDTTADRRQGEGRIRLKRQLQTVFDRAALGIALATPDGVILEANPAHLAMLGYRADQFGVVTFADMTHPDDRARSASLVADLIEGRAESIETEKRYRRTDGSIFWGRTTVAPSRNREGEVEHLIVTVQDVDRERQIDEALQESRQQLSSILDASPVALIGFDGEGRIRATEGAVIGGDDRLRLLGTLVWDLDGRLQPGAEAALRGEEAVAEGVFRERNFQCHFRPVTNTSGVIVGGVLVAVDETDLALARNEMARTERRLAALSHRATDIAIICDEHAVMEYVAPSSLEVLGYDSDDIENMSGWDFIHPDDVARLTDAWARTIAVAGPQPPIEVRARHKDGTYRWIEERFTNLLEDPDIAGVVVNLRDIHDARATQEALRASEQRYRSIFESAHEGIWVINAGGATIMSNQRMAELLGTTRGEMMGRSFDSYLAAVTEAYAPVSRRTQAEQVLVRSDGSLLHALVTSSPLHGPDGSFNGIVNMVVDIGEQKRHEAELEQLAAVDALTGMANRRSFIGRVDELLRSQFELAIAFFDIDDFKTINDSFGHIAGDEILRAVATTLSEVLESRGFMARFSGDEFVACLPGCASPEEASAVVAELLQVLRAPFSAYGREVYVTAGVGISVATAAGSEDRCSAEDLLAQADAAMYKAKDEGRGSVRVYDHSMVSELRRNVTLESAMRRGLTDGHFRVAFQPVVDVASGRTVAAEALCRWSDPELGEISPAEFIPLAERNGLIRDLGRLVLDQACAQGARWATDRPEHPIRVSVNVSGVQLADASALQAVAGALAASNLDPGLLCLEITESVLMADADSSVIALRRLKALGVRLSVDDFGTGYSSLSYLKRFPIDQLKIDRTFVSGLGVDLEDSAISDAILRLAEVLGLDVVAEGVENEDQRAALHRLGCVSAQGFLWSGACPPERLFNHEGAAVELAPAATVPTQEMERFADPGEAAAFLAHELRNPLSAILGYSEMLADRLARAGDVAARPATDAIIRNANRLDRIVGMLSDLRKIDRGTVGLHRELVDLRAVVDAVAESLAPALADHHLTIHGPAVLVNADAVAVEQILMNLLGNASKYTPAGTSVAVVIEKAGDEARVSVVDDGPGIALEQLDAIFRKFGRLDRTRSGVGIGLFISRGLARAHGGDLRCRRSVAGGAEFELLLPLPHNVTARDERARSHENSGFGGLDDAIRVLSPSRTRREVAAITSPDPPG